ncbi:sodium:solute symporter family transporter [Alteromonas sp. ASW11-130]|uniref:sodium:solute symporter family transporter n=1 Tax=Alteromonas sp. ASW11-130 TaxID=3015775 RepID=UPI002242089D|nr:sodium/solute symporter [Alteromonas sp. ASW11-130]MCW8090516.1 sodium/solute symporter [Alteromonas sp. ASW11-130]
MSILDYVIVSSYLIGLLLLGFFLRHQHNKQDYFLGSRSLSWPALTLSVMATQLSAVSFISAPAFVGLRDGGGLIWLSYELALPIAVALLLWKLMPTLHRIGVVSVYDFLEQRFSRFTRLLISAVFQFSRSFATAIMIYAVSILLQSTMGIGQYFSLLAIGIITLIYSAMGGMKAVVYGDAIQMVLIVAGACVCLWVGLGAVGGWNVVFDTISAARLQAVNVSTFGMHGNDFGLLPMLFGGVILYASYYGCDQSEAQRSLSNKSVGDLRKMLFAVAVLRFPIVLIYCLAGLVVGSLVMTNADLRQQIPIDNPDWMMPIFIVQYLPNGVLGLLVVAIMAAAMSSLSSAINSLAAVTTEDIQRVRKKRLNDNQYLNLARFAGICWGGITLTLSLYAGDIAPTIIEAINKIGSVFYGPVLATFLLGVHSRRVNAKGVNTGLLVGVAVNLSLWLSESDVFWFWWNVTGFAVCVVTALSISQLSQSERVNVVTTKGLSALEGLLLVSWTAILIAFCLSLPTLFTFLP